MIFSPRFERLKYLNVSLIFEKCLRGQKLKVIAILKVPPITVKLIARKFASSSSHPRGVLPSLFLFTRGWGVRKLLFQNLNFILALKRTWTLWFCPRFFLPPPPPLPETIFFYSSFRSSKLFVVLKTFKFADYPRKDIKFPAELSIDKSAFFSNFYRNAHLDMRLIKNSSFEND